MNKTIIMLATAAAFVAGYVATGTLAYAEDAEVQSAGFWKANAKMWESVAWEPSGESLGYSFESVFGVDVTLGEGNNLSPDPTPLST